jgi:hypothetical protein
MEKPKIIKIMEEKTGLKYYDLYTDIKIIKWNQLFDEKDTQCECKKKDIKYISEIEIQGKKYNLGSTCIKKIYYFLKNKLEIYKDKNSIKKEKIETSFLNTKNIYTILDEAMKKHKRNIINYKKHYDKLLKKYEDMMDDLEFEYMNKLNTLFNIEKKNINDVVFKIGKYKDKKFYEINDMKYLMWINKKYKENEDLSFNISLVKNINNYLKEYYFKFIKK